jgi:hypothetical protein
MGEHKITQEQIDALMAASVFGDIKMGDKTCVVTMKLPNGFEITESASCVDPANYDREIGIMVCKKRIAGRLWELEGYRLQCALAT